MDRFLPNGTMVTLSPEDEDLWKERGWFLWAAESGGRKMVVADVRAEGVRYRFCLHREVAFRMDPALLKVADRLMVKPSNGSFLDVRRENLEVIVRPRKRGFVRSARGYRDKPYRATQPAGQHPPWSRAGRRSRAQDARRGGAGDGPDAGGAGQAGVDGEADHRSLELDGAPSA